MFTEPKTNLYLFASIFLSAIVKMVKFSQYFRLAFALALVAFTASQLKRAIKPRKIFIMQDIISPDRPIRARVLLSLGLTWD